MEEKKKLATEGIHEKSRHIDEMNTLQVVQLIQEENEAAVHAVAAANEAIAKTVDRITDRIRCGGKLYYVGCGTSGRLGVMDASECPPTFGVSPDLVCGIIAGGDQALRRAVEGFEDNEDAGAAAIISHDIQEYDSVIGISASGGAPFVIGALKEARKRGAFIASISSNPATPIADLSDIGIVVETGAEVIMGSTRMKAGTAHKVILNMISTCVMIRLGYVCRNYMINLRPSNRKLKARMVSIVRDITGEDEASATARLEKADWVIRDAIQ